MMANRSSIGGYFARRRTFRSRPLLGRLAAALVCSLLIVWPLRAAAQAAPEAGKLLAMAAIDYSDTSGEPRDQKAEHQARLADFTRALREDLVRSGQYRVISVACPQVPCPPAMLLENARAAGAALLFYGGIHKMSTLIQNGKFQVVDLGSARLVFDRLITFRGDTDEAWQRAEHFIAAELLARPLSEQK